MRDEILAIALKHLTIFAIRVEPNPCAIIELNRI